MKIYKTEPTSPKLGDKVKQNGVTFEYKSINLGDGRGRAFMWVCFKVQLGTDLNGKRVFAYNIKAAHVQDGVAEIIRLRNEFKASLTEQAEAEEHPTVRQTLDKIIAEKDGRKAPETVKNLRCFRDHHFQDLMDVRVDKLTRQMLQSAIDREIDDGAAVSSEKNYVGMLNKTRKYLGLSSFTDMEFTEYSADVALDLADSEKHYLMPPEEVLKTVEKMNDPDFLHFVTFGVMSLRCAEIRGLKYSDIYEDGGRHYIHIHAQRNSKGEHIMRTKNRDSTRDILLDEKFYRSLEADQHDGDEYICPLSYSGYNQRMHKLRAVLNVPEDKKFVAHTLRHAYKTYSDPYGQYTRTQYQTGGWKFGNDVASSTYHGKDEAMHIEFMEQYYNRIFDRAKPYITIEKTA